MKDFNQAFVIKGKQLKVANAKKDLLFIVKECDFEKEMVEWIEGLSEQDLRAAWAILYCMQPTGRERVLFNLWEQKADLQAAAEGVRILGEEIEKGNFQDSMERQILRLHVDELTRLKKLGLGIEKLMH